MDTTLNGQVLDRRIPTDWRHYEKFALRSGVSRLLTAVTAPPLTVEMILNIPRQYRQLYDQGREGACVGYSQSWMMSILNRTKYHAPWLYHEAQLVDEWDDTPPEEGTSLRAGFDVLRTKGHRQMWGARVREEAVHHGIQANRWTKSVDEMRATLAQGVPINIGIWWYRQFSNPLQKPRLDDAGKPITEFGVQRYDWWIGRADTIWGPQDGGHAITVVGASDMRQAFALCNTWGEAYPFIVWLPYKAMERLLDEDGEAGIITDR